MMFRHLCLPSTLNPDKVDFDQVARLVFALGIFVVPERTCSLGGLGLLNLITRTMSRTLLFRNCVEESKGTNHSLRVRSVHLNKPCQLGAALHPNLRPRRGRKLRSMVQTGACIFS